MVFYGFTYLLSETVGIYELTEEIKWEYYETK